jgi:glycosyltransferase involved in cell wall biosynthesis
MSTKIRLVQMFFSFDVESAGGGLSRFAIELGRCLDEAIFEVQFCSLGYHNSGAENLWMSELWEDGYEAYDATNWDLNKPYKSFLNAQHTLNRRLSVHPVDILHSHSEFTDINAVWLRLLHPTLATIRTVHYGYPLEWRNRPFRRFLFTNLLYPILFNLEVGVNRSNTKRLNQRNIAKIFGKRAGWLPNAIPVQKFRKPGVECKAVKPSLGIPLDSPVIGSIGRLVDQKGFTFLLDAIPVILRQKPEAYFLIVGDGPLADEIKAKAVSLGIDGRVVFTGARGDIDHLLGCMDLFVSASLWEGLPSVILEAMACGVPVVATDIYGSNELIHDRHNGRLAPPQDGAALAAVILESLANPIELNRYVEQAHKDIQQFEISKIAQQYEILYRSLVKRSHAMYQPLSYDNELKQALEE